MAVHASARLTTVLLSSVAAVALAAESQKHVVLLVLDDIGWADVGYHGSDFSTPNIDKLAASGVKLERLYAYPQCSPTRSSILTGRHAFRTGMQHFTTLMPGSSAGLPKKDGTKTIAETFKAAGYSTHMVGKWHAGYSSWGQTPIGRGFDSYYGYLQGQTDYYNRTLPSCHDKLCWWPANKISRSPYGIEAAAIDVWDNKRPAVEDVGKYSLESYEEKVEALLKPYGSATPPSQPMFLYYAEQTLHIPLQAPPAPEHLERCRHVRGGSEVVNRTILCAMAGRMDESVGKLRSWLEKYNMWNDTIVFALADNGGMTHTGDIFPASSSSNWPLRGGKTTVFEGGVRAVSFVAGGAVPAAARGSSRSQLLHAVDVLPTLAEFAGVKISSPTDGVSAWSAIAQNASMERQEIPINIGVNPLGGFPWWFPKISHGGGLNYSSIISWPYKVMVGDTYISVATNDDRRRDGWWSVEGYTYESPQEELKMPYRLYNLAEDEAERNNLADKPEHKQLLERLVERVRWYAAPENGYVTDQGNFPWRKANPRFHSWTWAPFKADDGESESDFEAELEAQSYLDEVSAEHHEEHTFKMAALVV